MSRIYRVLTIVLLAILILLPNSAGAQEGSSNTIYIPIALKDGVVAGPAMVQFRSCGGYDGIPLQYKEVPVGELTALTEECTGGEAYPSPIAQLNEGVAIGGYKWESYNWHLVPHVGLFYDDVLQKYVDTQFMVNMGYGGAPPPYLSTYVKDGSLYVIDGNQVYTQTSTIEGWELTFHLDEAKPYVMFTRDLNTIWIVMDDANGILWVEVQTPDVEISAQDESPQAWGTWFYALCNGHLPTLEVMEEEHFIIARYQFE